MRMQFIRVAAPPAAAVPAAEEGRGPRGRGGHRAVVRVGRRQLLQLPQERNRILTVVVALR